METCRKNQEIFWGKWMIIIESDFFLYFNNKLIENLFERTLGKVHGFCEKR